MINEIQLSQLKDYKPIEDSINYFAGIQEIVIKFYIERLKENKTDYVFETFLNGMNGLLLQYCTKECNFL